MSVIHEQVVTHRFRTLGADIPGALAILCAIAFGTGIIDENVREMLAPVLWGSLGGVVVFGLLYRRAKRPLQHSLVVVRESGASFVRMTGRAMQEVFGPGFTWSHGVFIEHIDAHVASRDAPVVWVQIRAADGRSVVIRKALGIQYETPSWPQAQFLEKEQRIFSGEPMALAEALATIAEPTKPKIPGFPFALF